MPAKIISFWIQLTLAMAAAVVPADALSDSSVSSVRIVYTAQPSGISPQRMSMGIAVAMAVPDMVAVGAGVLVAVGKETAVNFELVSGLGSVVGCKTAAKAGVGCSCTCSRSI